MEVKDLYENKISFEKMEDLCMGDNGAYWLKSSNFVVDVWDMDLDSLSSNQNVWLEEISTQLEEGYL